MYEWENLQENWDGMGASPPTPEARATLAKIAERTPGIAKQFVPACDGGFWLEDFHVGDRELCVDIEPSGELIIEWIVVD